MDEKVRVLNKYFVYIGTDIFKKLPQIISLEKYSKVFIITDSIISEKWSKDFPKNTVKIIIPSGEQYKTIDSIKEIWKKLLLGSADRKSLVINIGGGVITDIGGFGASTYMRGIDFINVPTTLLSQVDASVGGKTGIDFAGVKNLIGTFNQPLAVICNTQFLTTLPNREFISGFGEIIKHGLIIDKKYFELVTSKKPRDFSKEELSQIILESIKIKASLVEEDEAESGKRRFLNFGHTIGHALESLSLETQTPLLHGEAVSIGMVAEAKISELLGMLSSEDVETIKRSLINANLPVSISTISLEKTFDQMSHDKKSERGSLNFTLLKGIGEGVINQNASPDIITQALNYISS